MGGVVEVLRGYPFDLMSAVLVGAMTQENEKGRAGIAGATRAPFAVAIGLVPQAAGTVASTFARGVVHLE